MNYRGVSQVVGRPTMGGRRGAWGGPTTWFVRAARVLAATRGHEQGATCSIAAREMPANAEGKKGDEDRTGGRL